jgi:hypothetical protein
MISVHLSQARYSIHVSGARLPQHVTIVESLAELLHSELRQAQ